MSLILQLSKFMNELEYADVTRVDFVVPPNPEMGDIALPCFALAKKMGKSSVLIAQEIAEKMITTTETVRGISLDATRAEGPYVNFVIDVTGFGVELTKEMDGSYGMDHAKANSILFEYSQPNTHKAFHIGHLRNVLLGASLINLFKVAGHTVKGVTYVNDVGTHVAQCLWAFVTLHNSQAPAKERGRWLGTVYAEAANAVAQNPELKSEVQEILKKLEAHDPEFEALWKETREWSLDGFDAIYNKLGVHFDGRYFESDVRGRGHQMVEELLERGLAKISEGATIMDLSEYGLDVLVIRKSDGTGLYSTSDLGLAEAKAQEDWDESVVITDIRQSLYFKQLFKTLELYGIERPQRHIGYEFVTLKQGQMSSRKGNVVLFEDFFDEVCEAAHEETKTRHPDWTAKKIKETGEKIALAAIKFGMLKVKPSAVITFDPTEALAFDGFNGPYVLYTFARIQSILKKAGEQKEGTSLMFGASEKSLLSKLAWYPEMVRAAVVAEDPSVICKTLFELCQQFGSYYEHNYVLSEDQNERAGRVALVASVAQVLENGLKLLGITPVNEM